MEDSSEAVKHTQPSVSVTAPIPSRSGGAFCSGFFNPAEQMNQLQQSVKRLEEQLAASNSKQSSDRGVTGQESSK